MFARFLQSRRARITRRASSIVAKASAIAVEDLEQRRLLSTVTFTTASTSGTPTAAAIYLEPGSTPGWVDVHYGSPTGFLAHTFTGAGDTDAIVSPSAGVTFYQQVPAAATPSGGITVSSGLGGTLEIDAGPSDQIMEVTASASTSGTVQVTDTTNLDFGSDVHADNSYGAGITNLTLRTNDNIGSTFTDITSSTELSTDGTLVNVPMFASATTLRIFTGDSTYDQIVLGGSETVVNALVSTGAGNDKVHLQTDGDDQTTATVDFGAGNGTGNGLGLGNELTIDGGATATLDQIGATSHTVVVDTVNVLAGAIGASLVVAHPSTIGDIEVDSGASATLNADSTVITLNDSGTLVANATSNITTLNVASGSTATFTGTAPATITTFTDSGTATVEAAANITTLDVTSGGTIDFTSTGPSTIGDFTDDGSATIEAPATIANMTGAGTAEFTGTSGSSTIDLVDHTGNVTVDSGATVDVTGTDGITTQSLFNTLTVAGNLTLNSASTVNDLEQSDGLVDLAQTSTWKGGAADSTFNTIYISGGLFNVEGQDVLTNTDKTTIFNYIKSAYNTGSWDGTTGITSGFAIAYPSNYAIGYADGADDTATGMDLTATGQTLIRPTRCGDATLNGRVQAADFNLLSAHFNATGADWAMGDFNYDQRVKAADFNLLSANFNGSFPTS